MVYIIAFTECNYGQDCIDLEACDPTEVPRCVFKMCLCF